MCQNLVPLQGPLSLWGTLKNFETGLRGFGQKGDWASRIWPEGRLGFEVLAGGLAGLLWLGFEDLAGGPPGSEDLAGELAGLRGFGRRAAWAFVARVRGLGNQTSNLNPKP